VKIDPAVTVVLFNATADGNAVTLNGQLDPALYAKVNKVLVAAGGKWNRKTQAHLFPEPAAPILEALLSDGKVATAQDEGWFPTPAPVVARLIMLADLEPRMEVLEPSAGEGAIAKPAASWGCTVDCIELNPKRADVLRAAGFARWVANCDFLTVTPHPAYDRVLMNPPFAGKADIAHVRHALKFLRPGGLLVAVMGAGVSFRDDRATAGFRDLVGQASGEMIRLPGGSFRESGTGVGTVLVTIPVPAEAEESAA
jgi:predicted RNA methylase